MFLVRVKSSSSERGLREKKRHPTPAAVYAIGRVCSLPDAQKGFVRLWRRNAGLGETYLPWLGVIIVADFLKHHAYSSTTSVGELRT